MKKCVFIIPFFGNLPKSFSVFLKSCASNKDFDFLLFTDDPTEFNYPSNVIVNKMTFDEIRYLIQSKFDFEISLENPYKLCDYKPAYGYIFEDYISEYLFWGHCDVDTILGNLEKMLPLEFLNKYDKLFCLGHFILYRNTYENRRVFMKMAQGRSFYMESFTTETITAFDETWNADTSVNTVFLSNNRNVFMEDWSVNFRILPTAFVRIKFNPKTYSFNIVSNQKDLYMWENGSIIRYYFENGVMKKNEELYMHFQGRKMRFNSSVLDSDRFIIVPNYFISCKNEIKNRMDFVKQSRYRLCFHFLEVKLKRLKKRLKGWAK